MIKIDLLKNHPHAIPRLSTIWHDVLGKIWMPEIELDEIESLYRDEINHDMPLTYIALHDEIPVGSCTLELQGGIRPVLGPWIGDLVIDPHHQKRGIGKMLIDVAIQKAKDLNFEKLYLFTFDPKIVQYYEYLGWRKIGIDTFKSHPVSVMEIAV